MKNLTSLVCIAAALFIGCGGDGDVQFGGSSSSTSTGGTNGTGGEGGSGTAGMGGQGGSGMGGSGGTGGTGGSATTSSSSSSGGGVGMVPCGDTVCDTATQKCCTTMAGASCIAADAACQGLSLTCTSAANCADGNVCCLVFSGPGTPPSGVCQMQCTGGPSGTGTQLCQTDAECASGLTCKAGQVPGGFMTCSP